MYELNLIQDQINYLYAACFSPPQSTFLHAIRQGFFVTFPNLTAKLVSKYLIKSVASAKGHLDQQYKNCRSTTSTTFHNNTHDNPLYEDVITNPITERTNLVFLTIESSQDFSPTNQISTDQTGRFPILSNKGNQYIMLMYDYDSNDILVHPMKNRTATEIINAFTFLYERLCRAGLKPRFHKLDNEAPKKLTTKLNDEKIDYQQVPPHIHRRNPAERAIRTLKHHFIAGLCSTDPNFLM